MNHWVASEFELFLRRTGCLCDHHVHARHERADRLLDRESSRYVGIERLLDAQFAFPDLCAATVRQSLDVIAFQRALEVTPEHGVHETAVADAVNLDGDAGCVDADEGYPALARPRQHIGLAGEARGWLAVAHVDVELGGFRERLLHRRRHARAQRDGVMLAMLEPFDAELAVLRGNGGLVLTGNDNERREIDALGQVF